MQLTKDAIVHTALELLNTYGLADTTMRRVASTLGVAPGALYWHIANKQELIAQLAAHIVAPIVDAPSSAGSDDITELALALRSCLLAHRDGAETAAAGLSQPHNPTWTALVDKFAQCLHTSTGLPGAQEAALAIVHLVMGSTTMEQARAQLEALHPSAESAGQNSAPAADAQIGQCVTMIVAGMNRMNTCADK